MKTSIAHWVRLAAATLLLLPVLATAQQGADLNISPKRLVFSGANRSAVVYVFNRGTSGASYTIELVERVMLPDGQIIAVSEATSQPDGATVAARASSAARMLSFSPRRVTLAPGESQVIRVRVMQPAGLAAGEYRSHLTVSTLPPEDTGLTAEQAANVAEGQLAVQVVSLLSLSIPVIVRQNVAAGSAGIEGVVVRNPEAQGTDAPASIVDLELTRGGTGSIYGNLEVLAQGPGTGKPESIGGIKGIAVYPEIAHRTVHLPLTRRVAPGESLTVRFTDDDSSSGTILATATVNVR